MAGIYLHIPFCKKKCAYCDFYSLANTTYQEKFVEALLKEIEMQKDYLGNESIQTIYFGGGTPSVLNGKELDKIFNAISKHFTVEANNEITLEANPDDLSISYIRSLQNLPINRLSVGIQSFIERDLQIMKRQHTVDQAIRSVVQAQDVGIENISIDLIYGLPNLSMIEWENNIQKALELNIKHISAYHLTIEPKTLFHKYYQNNKIVLPSENESLEQFKLLKDLTAKKGFLHYEISNFARDGYISLHNTNYWMGVKYLGLGPSAHSYNLTSREWNISNLNEYISGISNGKLIKEREILSQKEKFNDYIITSLRTMWGLNTEIVKNNFGQDYLNQFLHNAKKFLEQNLLIKSLNNFKLSENGMFISDSIISSLLAL